MKRPRRILFNALTVLSLLLAIATAGLWVRSVFVWYFFEKYRPDEYAAVVLRSGEVDYTLTSVGKGSAYFAVLQDKGPGVSTPYNVDWHYRASSDDLVQNPFLTNRFMPSTPFPFTWKDHGAGNFSASIALWFPLIAFSILPLLTLTRWVRRPCRPGRCPFCGYDIRASPARCSECGREPTGPAPFDASIL